VSNAAPSPVVVSGVTFQFKPAEGTVLVYEEANEPLKTIMCGEYRVTLNSNKLSVDDVHYGSVSKGDFVLIELNAVFVNGKQRNRSGKK